MDGWDILQKQKDPILTIKVFEQTQIQNEKFNPTIYCIQVADKGLNCIRCHEGGSLLAVGDDCGKTYVIKMNDWFVTPGKNDKALLTAVSYVIINDVFFFNANALIYPQMFDRETRREKIIEAKQRELKLKTKSSAKVDPTTTKDKHAQVAEAEARMVKEAEREFMELISEFVSYLNTIII